MVLPTQKQRFIIPDLPTADDLLPFLRRIDENRWYSNFGPLANAFEEQFADRMAEAHKQPKGSFYAVGMASGYQALTVGLRLLGVGPGDKVLVPAVTFSACPLAVTNLGAEAVLSDVDPAQWTLTPAIARAIAQKVKLTAVMPVSVYGFGLPAEEWDAFTQETGVKVLIDAAAAVESQRYLKHGLVAHSLHALKPFGIGEGGILVSPDTKTADSIRQRINFGLNNRISYQTGENAKMSEYHAAVALAQLARWDGIKRRRHDAYLRLKEALTPLAPALVPHPDLDRLVVSSFMVSLKEGNASELFTALTDKGVAAHRTYLPPLYEHPVFSSLETVDASGRLASTPQDKARQMTGAEYMKQSVLGLPFHAFLTDEEIYHTAKIAQETL